MAWTSVQAAPGSRSLSRIDELLEQIRQNIEKIRQSVDGVDKPPLAEQILGTYSLTACVSLDAVLQAGLNGSLTVPVRLEGKAEPGAVVISALAKAWAAVKASVSGDINAGATASATACLDLWKLAKVLLEDTVQEAGVRVTSGSGPSGLLEHISDNTQEFLKALAHANPASAFNRMLARADAFGFDPALLTTAAGQFEAQILGVDILSGSITDPDTVLTGVEQQLDALARTLPFAGDLRANLSTTFTSPQQLDPCTYKDLNVPMRRMQGLMHTWCDAGRPEFILDLTLDGLENLLALNRLTAVIGNELLPATSTTESHIKGIRDNVLTKFNGVLSRLSALKDDIKSQVCRAMPILNCN
jgi:hypothetical protein